MGCNSSKRVQKEPKDDITEHRLSIADVEAQELKSIISISQIHES